MRKPEHSAEPSIEEILASIRKIIADDGAQHSARAETFSETPPEAASRRRDPEPPSRRLPPQPVAAFYPEPDEPAAAIGEDDILELTEDSMIEDEGEQSGMSFTDARNPADARQPEPLQAGIRRRSVRAAIGRGARKRVFQCGGRSSAPVWRVKAGNARPHHPSTIGRSPPSMPHPKCRASPR